MASIAEFNLRVYQYLLLAYVGPVPVEGNQGIPGSGTSGQVFYYRLTCSFISRRVRIEVDSSEGYVSFSSIELLEHHCLSQSQLNMLYINVYLFIHSLIIIFTSQVSLYASTSSPYPGPFSSSSSDVNSTLGNGMIRSVTLPVQRGQGVSLPIA